MTHDTDQYLYGMHAVTAALKNQADQATKLLILTGKNQRLKAILALADQIKLPIERLSRTELNDLVAGANHQGVVLQIQTASPSVALTLSDLCDQIHDQSLVLILDGVQDPHNLGACLRTADACGVQAVVIPEHRAAAITPTVRKVACGGAETVPVIQVTNLAQAMRQLQQQGVWLYGLCGDANDSLYQTQFAGACGLVLGAEGAGLRRLTRENCDFLMKIPMQGSVSSLNVSVATGVSLFEVCRQRGM